MPRRTLACSGSHSCSRTGLRCSSAWSRQIQQGLRDLPGVRSTSLSFIGLFDPGEMSGSISIEGYEPPPGPPPLARYNAVSHDYFGTVGMKLVAGRPFTDRDVAGAPRVAG